MAKTKKIEFFKKQKSNKKMKVPKAKEALGLALGAVGILIGLEAAKTIASVDL